MTQPPPPIPDPDLPLVHAAQAGDFAAFDQLVTRHERSLYTLARRIVTNPADAQEVVQETFLSVVEHLKDFARQSTFRTWLTRIATNNALRILRRRRTKPTVPLGDTSQTEPPLPHPDFIAPWREDPAQLAQQAETRHLLD